MKEFIDLNSLSRNKRAIYKENVEQVVKSGAGLVTAGKKRPLTSSGLAQVLGSTWGSPFSLLLC